MLDAAAYEEARQSPVGPAAMFQKWRSLLFLHFPCDPAEIQALLPKGLTVDTYDGQAWVGLVPFRMKGVRPRFLPPMPGLSAFPETNVRTYVHREGQAPGVWFFSLDAANAIACRVARRFFSLPYVEATMRVTETGTPTGRKVEYQSIRTDGSGRCEIVSELGEEIGEAKPDSLEYFLVERYRLYAEKQGTLFIGRVHHRPYPLRKATAPVVRESLVQAAGITSRPFLHVVASDGVDVGVWPLQ